MEMVKLNPDFKPPVDYKQPEICVSDKAMIPQDETQLKSCMKSWCLIKERKRKNLWRRVNQIYIF